MTPLSVRFERVAHRGAKLEFPENTLLAFTRALERGADAIELDVHRTADGMVVVHHDPVVGGITISESRWERLEQIDLGAGARLPTLPEVLEMVDDRAVLYVELKGDAIEDAVLATIRDYHGRVAVHSFDHAMVARAARAAPDIARGVLLDRGTPDAAVALESAVERTGARDVWPHASLVDSTVMAAARRRAVRVIPWTVNSASTARMLLDLGVDGVCTDDVRLLANL